MRWKGTHRGWGCAAQSLQTSSEKDRGVPLDCVGTVLPCSWGVRGSPAPGGAPLLPEGLPCSEVGIPYSWWGSPAPGGLPCSWGGLPCSWGSLLLQMGFPCSQRGRMDRTQSCQNSVDIGSSETFPLPTPSIMSTYCFQVLLLGTQKPRHIRRIGGQVVAAGVEPGESHRVSERMRRPCEGLKRIRRSGRSSCGFQKTI